MKQIFIFGAGFDSRAIRFSELNKTTIFYELDAYHTQEAKIKQYKKRNINIPENLIFIPINFNNENIRDKLIKYGFNKNKTSLFLLEGLLMYLDENAVINIFNIINGFSVKGNWLLFDFIFKSVLRKENKYFGEDDIYKRLNEYREAWKFGIEESDVIKYFENMKFKVLYISNSKKLENKYFLNATIDLINGTHSIAWLEV